VQDHKPQRDVRKRPVQVADDARPALSTSNGAAFGTALAFLGVRLRSDNTAGSREGTFSAIAVCDEPGPDGGGKAKQECCDHDCRSWTVTDIASRMAAQHVRDILQRR
jgi:hypothetical protein